MERSLVLHCTTIAAPRPNVLGALPSEGHVLLHYATLAELRPRMPDLSALLDPQEQQRAARFVHDIDRERYVLGHGYLRDVLGAATGQAPQALTFQRGPFGKPTIDAIPLHFNFSDTKDAVLLAIAHQELGVDIESMSRRVNHERVAEHYFTPEEITDINASPDRKRRFLDFWTRKEAVLKASGVGIMDDLRALRVDAERNSIRIIHDDFVRMAAPEYHVQSFAIGEEHLVSVASRSTCQLSLAS
ncbi:MAG: 4'-phosphopantetheinyl transferase superfamily protein [Flavobacteriales bacterium]